MWFGDMFCILVEARLGAGAEEIFDAAALTYDSLWTNLELAGGKWSGKYRRFL